MTTIRSPSPPAHAVAVVVALLLLIPGRAEAQSFPRKYLTTSSTNSNLVQTGRVMLRVILPINTTTTIYYLKLYNKATAPTCGTDTPLWTVPIPYGTNPSAAAAGSGAVIPTGGLQFPLGLGFCVTGGLADNDNTNAAPGVVINLGAASY